MEYKFLRRFIAPAICCGAMFGFSRDWKVFIQMPFMFGSLSMGYGAESVSGKILRRLAFGSANGISSSIYNGIKMRWKIVVWQFVAVSAACVFFGVLNPFNYMLAGARTEELFIGLVIFLIPLLSASRQ